MNFYIHIFRIMLLVLASSFAFTSCNENYAPKPRGYFRIELPAKNYVRYAPSDCPFSFEIPDYANMARDTNRLAEPCWMYLQFPRFNGEVYLSYKSVDKNLNKLIEDAHTLVYKHTVKADDISENKIITANNAAGVVYEIGGNAASALQFFVTDSSAHFIRGALYFNTLPNNDSIAPVVTFLKEDVLHLISSLHWQ